ncbi:MAG: DUF418 domain-containing protein [Erythrobacter sp.]|uniref:DUF418 domain-containing protein n=1 Tax=Erythrobacter sp. TaxID=1042 RepID=UPI00260F39C9|nr:DUF418 domain-containing protein [Erythrobacter sp.]MDJ0979449.1 DUF418 domain-containing protein [Erythrobacter sp.]
MVTTEQERGRIIELDALRGLAVIGIVWMNVYIFALPSQAYYNPLSWGGDSAIDYTVWWVSFVFVEDKFRTLFAMMFGAGVAILMERGGERPNRAHYARMLVLFGIGLAHGILLADNDVLRAYALAGLALPLFMRLRPRYLIAIVLALIFVHIVIGTFYAAAQKPQYWEMNFGTHPFGLEVTYARGEEAFGERLDRRLDRLLRTTIVMIASIPLNLASMLVGLAAWKSGMLAAKWPYTRLLIVASLAIATSAFALIYYANEAVASGYAGVTIAENSLLLSAPLDLLMGAGYAAAAMALFQFARSSLPVRVLADAGRLSLTNYLLTSVILATLFASWGFGLFGTVSRSEALLFSFVPIAVMLVFSPIWLRKFGQGPFERAWRGVAGLLS